VPDPLPPVAPPVVETLILDLSEPAPRRDRKRLVTVAALIVLLVGGVAGYLVTRGPDRGTPRPPTAEAPLAPAPSAPPAVAPGPRPSPDLARPAALGSPGHPVVVASRPTSHTPAPGTPTAAASLTATYRYVVGGVTEVLTGYVGTVRITNKGASPAIGWTVRLTVPLANAVTVETSDVVVTREGSTVVFTPLPPVAPIAAGDTKAFSFELSGPLAAVPTGCTVNGTPCT